MVPPRTSRKEQCSRARQALNQQVDLLRLIVNLGREELAAINHACRLVGLSGVVGLSWAVFEFGEDQAWVSRAAFIGAVVQLPTVKALRKLVHDFVVKEKGDATCLPAIEAAIGAVVAEYALDDIDTRLELSSEELLALAAKYSSVRIRAPPHEARRVACVFPPPPPASASRPPPLPAPVTPPPAPTAGGRRRRRHDRRVRAGLPASRPLPPPSPFKPREPPLPPHCSFHGGAAFPSVGHRLQGRGAGTGRPARRA